MNFHPEWAWIIVAILDVVAVLRAVTAGRGVNTTLTWLFAIIAFPGAGATAYLLFGNPSVRWVVRRKRRSVWEMRRALNARTRKFQSASPPHRTLTREEEGVLAVATAATGWLPSQGNAVDLFAKNDDANAHIRRTIERARQSVWVEMYIIQNDMTGREFMASLIAKAAEGVEVRLLYDAIGSFRIHAGHIRELQAAGGKVAAFMPLNPLRRRWSVNLRNHRKIIVVDGETGYAGSLNVGDAYSGRRRRHPVQFRDTHLAIQGPAVEDLAWTFAEDWFFSTNEQIKPVKLSSESERGSSVVAVVPSGPDQDQNAHRLVYITGLSMARERCYLTSPYFIPDDPTLFALVTTAMRGVDVKILLPKRSDVRLIMSAARSYYSVLLKAGVRIYEYDKAILHAKTMVVDRTWGIVGSANVDIRSFQFNFEVSALVCDPELATKLEVDFRRDMADSKEVTMEEVNKRPWWVRIGLGAARLLSPIL